MKFWRTLKFSNIGLIAILLLTCAYKYMPEKGTYISLSPAITEILYAINAQDKLKAVTLFSNYPKEAREKPKVGSYFLINKESILKFNAEYILCLNMQKQVVDDLKVVGIKPIYFKTENLEDIKTNILKIGNITNHLKEAENLIKKLEHQTNTAKAKVSKKVLFVVNTQPFIAAGNKSFVHDIITKAGHKNITDFYNSDFPLVSLEYAAMQKPDIVITRGPNEAEYLKKYLKGKFIILTKEQNDSISRHGPRAFKMLEFFSKL